MHRADTAICLGRGPRVYKNRKHFNSLKIQIGGIFLSPALQIRAPFADRASRRNSSSQPAIAHGIRRRSALVLHLFLHRLRSRRQSTNSGDSKPNAWENPNRSPDWPATLAIFSQLGMRKIFQFSAPFPSVGFGCLLKFSLN